MEGNAVVQKNKKKVSGWVVAIYIFFCFMCVVYIAPIAWVALSSLKTRKELIKAPFAFPTHFEWDNYVFAWTAGKLGIAMRNSVIVCVAALLLTMLIGSMAAFAIGKMQWKLANASMTYILIGMMIPIHCVIIPLFVRFARIGLSDSLIGVIIPYVTFSLPVTIFIMTGFFRSIPNELFESACIDGCTIYKMFFSIALPLSRTGLFVTGLMTFVANWNELLMAMVFISDDMKKTLPVSLSKFVGPYQTNYAQMFAAIVIAIIPTIIVYCIFSNQIVDGLTQGAVKG